MSTQNVLDFIPDNFQVSPASAPNIKYAHRVLGKSLNFGELKKLKNAVLTQIEHGKFRPKAKAELLKKLADINGDVKLFVDDWQNINLRLIAAAPDLLRASVAALTIINRECPEGSIAHDLRAAIAKAEGAK